MYYCLVWILLASLGGGPQQELRKDLEPGGSDSVRHRLQRSGRVQPGRPLADRVIFVQIPARAAAEAERRPAAGLRTSELPPSARIVIFDPASPAEGATVLTPGFAAAGFPDLSFDGKRVLFVGRQAAGDPYQVWEMGIDGAGLRRITAPPDASGPALQVAGRSAIYLSTIYTIDAEAPVYQIAFMTNQNGGALHTCRLDGTRIRRITFNPEGVSDPLLLSDGRLLLSYWSSWTHGGPTAAGATSLFTINTDGTDIFPFAAVHEPKAIRSMPCETADGRIVYVESSSSSSARSGQQASVNVRPSLYGGGSLVSVARTRSLHSRRVIADDPDGVYHSPSPAGDGLLLVSHRMRKRGTYSIHLLESRTGERIAQVYDDPQWDEIDALLVRPRPRPEGRSSVVDDRMTSGWLYCMDAYLSDREEAERIKPGGIDRLRIIRAIIGVQGDPIRPLIREGDQSDNRLVAEEVLGEVAVESDGSFFIEVPARTPLRLETLSKEGKVLQSMRHWMWVMPKEGRGCVGCHEDRELTPPNRHTEALRQAPKQVGVEAGELRPPAAASPSSAGDSK